MRLLINGQFATDLDDGTFERVLNIYPEEEFAKRKLVAEALHKREIEYQVLKAEAAKMILPWQMFFLDRPAVDAELTRIESLRHKVATKVAAKRAGRGNVTSRRILDRLIRCQTYITDNHALPKNKFCGSLKGRSVDDAVERICRDLDINMSFFRSRNKEGALAYLIEKIEAGQINVCQGVLANKILPALSDSRSVYKNTSGFVIRDDSVPFIFIPSEVSPDEREGRQIFTLLYLLVLIGLEAYEYQIEKDFKISMLSAAGRQKTAYSIVAEFLLPAAVTEPLRGIAVTADARDKLARQYKLTPSAVVLILRKRGILDQREYNSLLPPTAPPVKSKGRTPSIELSVRKFNGKYAFDYVNRDFAAAKITPVQTQYLLFGSINKSGFRKYRSKLGI